MASTAGVVGLRAGRPRSGVSSGRSWPDGVGVSRTWRSGSPAGVLGQMGWGLSHLEIGVSKSHTLLRPTPPHRALPFAHFAKGRVSTLSEAEGPTALLPHHKSGCPQRRHSDPERSRRGRIPVLALALSRSSFAPPQIWVPGSGFSDQNSFREADFSLLMGTLISGSPICLSV